MQMPGRCPCYAFPTEPEEGNPMKTLYLMRHGETLFNVHYKNQG